MITADLRMVTTTDVELRLPIVGPEPEMYIVLKFYDPDEAQLRTIREIARRWDAGEP